MNWLVFNRDRQVRYDCCSDGTVLPCRSEGTPRALATCGRIEP
jgi:hypothetical protein